MEAKKYVLIVEDEVDIAEVLRFELDRQDYIVDVCSNGLHALKLIKQKKPDLIIIDIVMPKMNGFVLVQELEKLHGDLPIVIVSGAYAPKAKDLNTSLNLLASFAKPFSVKDITLLLSQHFQQAS